MSASAQVLELTCAGCGAVMLYRGLGRPRRWCESCKAAKLAAQQRAYREAHKEEVAAQQRAYYEAHKEEVAARQRAYREARRDPGKPRRPRWICTGCGERLARKTEDGLCGFCRKGIAA